MKKIITILCLTLLAFSLPADGGEDPSPYEDGFSEEKASVYGYLVNYLSADIPDDGEGSAGNTLSLRLKADFKPENRLSFHAELSYKTQLGSQNPYTLMARYGIPGIDQSQYPFEDFTQEANLDHAYGNLNLGRADIQFGKIPIAWGTGYVFNPTAKASSTAFLDPVAEETPGILALAPSLALSESLALSGYLAFQDSSMKTTADPEDGDWDRLPWGLKVTAVVGSFDLSAGFLKEVTPNREAWYATADFAGAAGDFGVYGEAAFNIPYEDGEFSFSGKSWDELLEACLGFDYTIPRIDIESRLEYYHFGPGAQKPDTYDAARVLSGEASVQARDYLFVSFSRIFADYLTLSASGLINLNDGSFALLPEAEYSLLDNFQVSAGSILYLGDEGSEFNGEYEVYGSRVDLTVPSLYIKAKLSF